MSGISTEPLAARMRPRTIDEFIGQDHILGPGRLLRRAIAADLLGSIILSGPPGTGKTTLARVIANTTKSDFTSLNAVLGGVKEVRAAIEKAQEVRNLYDRRTILFVDEVHRWNKAQQDALLPWVENGTVILIGATTENPFFEVNSALVSRSRIFQLTALGPDDLRRIAEQALADVERGYGAFEITIRAEALDHLIAVCDGDARTLLNALQLAVETTPDRFPPEAPVHIGLREAEESIQRRALLYDREGDYHYDTISAFIKSLRGSDPDAALYWMARMIRAGEDPHYLFRRMLVFASEDVGLADPHALAVTEAAAAAFDRVGMPEGQYHLSHAALYLSTAPKSNSTLGYFDAAQAVEEEMRREVPKHLRDSNRDGAGFGHGEGYKYPHSYRDHWVAQAYLPADLAGRVFYHPSSVGYEGTIAADVERRRELQLAEVDDAADDGEVLTFTSEKAGTGGWVTRASSASPETRAALRMTLFDAGKVLRHSRILLYEPGPPVHVWEGLRRAPEGLVVALFEEEKECERAAGRQEASDTQREHRDATARDGVDEPVLLSGRPSRLTGGTWKGEAAHAVAVEEAIAAGFEAILCERLLTNSDPGHSELEAIASLLAPTGRAVFAEPAPMGGRRLSNLAREAGAQESIVEALVHAERTIFSQSAEEELHGLTLRFDGSRLRVTEASTHRVSERRRLPSEIVERWFSTSREHSYASALPGASDGDDSPARTSGVDSVHTIGTPDRAQIQGELVRLLGGRQVTWHRAFHIITVCRS